MGLLNKIKCEMQFLQLLSKPSKPALDFRGEGVITL